MSFHLSLFKMVGLHYMPFFACHDCKDNTSSAAGLKIYRIQLSGDELRLTPALTMIQTGYASFAMGDEAVSSLAWVQMASLA